MTAKVTAAEFTARHTPEPNTGCWIWTGPVAPNGDVVAIRSRLDGGETHGRIADDFGVQRTAIWAIANGRTWRSVVGRGVEVLP